MSTWEVKAWCQAPGEFPSWALQTETVQAQSAVGASIKAHKKFEQVSERVEVRSVVCVDPPVGEQPS